MSTVLYAFLGGLLPALLWLTFWLMQDRKNPEPLKMLALAFGGGMVAVPLVLPFEEWIFTTIGGAATVTLTVIILWSLVEEAFKYFAARFLVLGRCSNNEPLDPIMYMITAALGFAALENTLFLLDPVTLGNTAQSLFTGNLRFLGATLLHVLASSMIGLSLALTYYRRGWRRIIGLTIGIIVATALHTLFNFFIIESDGSGTFFVFASVWAGIVVLILMLEKIKRMKRDVHPLPRCN